ncbi:MAG: glycerate kinase [Actinomycetota bacterium]|nr:glycerate kinase [Actinomycetota bacterium]
MRVVVAPDSFGGTLSAAQAASAIAAGWRDAAPAEEVVERPLSDGGPGFVEVLRSGLEGVAVPVATTDPLGRPVTGQVFVSGDTAYVESAHACGLHLLAAGERDPLLTSSYGLGILLAAAVESGAGTIVVGLGGSATNDGGAGLLAALGAVPVDASGAALPPGGAALRSVSAIAGAPRLRQVSLVAASDVDNPLLGPAGASAVFGPQKGATEDDVLLLDDALSAWAGALQALPGCPDGVADLPGAGAAGGLGAALLALGARFESGIALVRRAVGFDAALDGAAVVITGEGSLDAQSLRGKVVTGVAAAAAERGLPCVAIAGQVSLGRQQLAAAGIEAAHSLVDHVGSVEAAMSHPAAGLRSLSTSVAKQWSRGHPRVG